MSREATTIIRRGRRFLPNLKKLERKRLNLDEFFLPTLSTALVEQIRTMDKHMLIKILDYNLLCAGHIF